MQTILLATDGSPSAAEAQRLAIELAKLTNSPLAAVSVLHVTAPTFGGGFGYTAGELYAELAKTERERIDHVLGETERAAKEAGVPFEGIVGNGNAVEEICRVAHDLQPRMLVIGAHGWGLVQRVVYGSVSAGVLHHAPCPILIVPAPQAALAEGKAA